jgi:PTH1 family peptidyl-tRNA hydrolase
VDLQLLVGLGNPGPRYQATRHNVGFAVLEALAAAAGQSFRSQSKLHGQLAEVGQGADRLRLLMPQTFMNDSGRAVRATLDWFGLRADQLLVIVDDMDLPLGRLRLRASGSAGGHNGLRSIIQHLGTQEFARLRIGIGAPAGDPQERKSRTVGHVLGPFSSGERKILEQVLAEVICGVARIRSQGLERAGNHLNSFRVLSQAS